MSNTSKKAFDLSCNSAYVATPDQLCLIGGRCLPKNQRGPLDTAHKPGEHELYDERLTTIEIDDRDPDVANIDAYGVLSPVLIAKDKETGYPVVVDGRQRVRRARLANLRRAARGEKPISINCMVIRSVGTRLLGAMIAANEVRDDDSPLVRLGKAKALMERGVSEEDAAMTFGLELPYFRQLLAYDDTAIDAVKHAVASGELSPTAAVEMVKVAKTPKAQKEALAATKEAKAATGRRTTIRSAVNAAKTATGKASAETGAGLVPSKRELKALTKLIAKITEPAADARVLLEDDKDTTGIEVSQGHVVDSYYLGVQDTLALVAGKCTHKGLLKMLSKASKSLS